MVLVALENCTEQPLPVLDKFHVIDEVVGRPYGACDSVLLLLGHHIKT
jgi:hypothetical protein